MGSSLEKLIEEVRSLSPEEQRRLRDLLDEEAQGERERERARLAASIRGKYRDVLSSSDEFNARKAAEIALEDRRR